MTYAQRCKACEEVFILEARVESCPSCAAAMPVKKRKFKFDVKADVNQRLKDLLDPTKGLLTWQQWKDSEPKRDIISKQPLNDVITEFLGINEEIAGFYNLLYGFMSKNTELIKSAKDMSSEDMCDFGFFCREAENTLDELRKEVKARKELCGQIIAARKTQESLNDPTIKLKVTGQYATGLPDVKMQAQLPKKFTDEYYQLTDYFGINREIAATGVLRLDWKATGELITQLANDGKPTPEGFGKQYPTYVTTFRRRRKT